MSGGIVFAGVVLAACGSVADGSGARRESQRDDAQSGSFSFRSRVEITGRDTNDPIVEAARIKDLERGLRSNRMCSSGYTITSRRTIIQIGEHDQVEYFGQCIG